MPEIIVSEDTDNGEDNDNGEDEKDLNCKDFLLPLLVGEGWGEVNLTAMARTMTMPEIIVSEDTDNGEDNEINDIKGNYINF